MRIGVSTPVEVADEQGFDYPTCPDAELSRMLAAVALPAGFDVVQPCDGDQLAARCAIAEGIEGVQR